MVISWFKTTYFNAIIKPMCMVVFFGRRLVHVLWWYRPLACIRSETAKGLQEKQSFCGVCTAETAVPPISDLHAMDLFSG